MILQIIPLVSLLVLNHAPLDSVSPAIAEDRTNAFAQKADHANKELNLKEAL
jgi:hypothetical protein